MDAIAAICTPLGEGAVAIIRLSGKEALQVAAKVYQGPIASYKSHTLHLGKIVDRRGTVVDEVLIASFLAPHSYTGENTVEIYCHGGILITQKVLQAVLQAGARAARPGEFTFQAYMNGKLDLTQAEAVQELITAKSDLALSQAEQHLEGALSRKIRSFQKALFDVAAILEAWVDFPEEGLEFASLEEVVETLRTTLADMERLSHSFYEGKVVSHGLSLCLIGAPNVGKSSLMNALLGKDRAIVTDIAGTTRDLLEEEFRLMGLQFRLLDTAGIRNTEEIVEREGILRSKKAMERADLILLILDSTRPLLEEDQQLLKTTPPSKTLVLWNKIDVPSSHPKPEQAIGISAKTEEGLQTLREKILEVVFQGRVPSKEEVLLTSLRHKEALDQAITFLSTLIQGLQSGVSPEFLAADMRGALLELGKIIGTDVTEEILSAIFSKFCVGK